MIFGRLFSGFWNVVIVAAIIAVLAGTAVMSLAMHAGGKALGQGIVGGVTFVTSIGGGWAEAKAVDDELAKAQARKDAQAQKRAEQKRAAAGRAN